MANTEQLIVDKIIVVFNKIEYALETVNSELVQVNTWQATCMSQTHDAPGIKIPLEATRISLSSGNLQWAIRRGVCEYRCNVCSWIMHFS
jgi:hypothetical protein